MTTRWYLPSTSAAPAISPTQSAVWDDFGSMARVIASLTKTNQAFSTQTVTDATATVDRDALAKQFIYRLPPGTAFTTSQTFSGRVLVAEGASASNLRSQVVVRVIAVDGSTVRATLYAGDATTGSTNPTSEWALTTLTNRQMPRGATVTCAANYTAESQDYLVVEVGYHKHVAASTTGTLRFGDNGASDLGANETDTADNNSWFEWSGTLPTLAAATDANGDIFVPLDTFTAADGTVIGTYDANWGSSVGDATNAKIDTNRVYSDGGTFQETIHLHALLPTSSQYDVRADVRSPNHNSMQVMLLTRGSGTKGGGTFTAYKTYLMDVSIELQKCVNGANTGLASFSRNNYAGLIESIEVRCRDAGKTVVMDGVAIMSNSNNDITGAGKVGFTLFPIGSAGSTTNGFQIDNYQAQDVVSTPAELTPRGSIQQTVYRL